MESKAIIVFGNVGSDAGYWYLGADGKIHHVPGWDPEVRQAFEALEKNFAILQRASAKQIGVNQVGGVAEKLGGAQKLGM